MAGGPRAGTKHARRTTGAEAARASTSCLKKSVLLSGALSVLGTLIATALAVTGVAGRATGEHVALLFNLTAAAMFVGAGLLGIARWRMLGDARSLLAGSGLVVLGGISIPLTNLADVLIHGDEASHLRAATAIVTTLVSVLLVARALTAPPAEELRAIPVLGGACLAAVSGFVAVLSAYVLAPEVLRSTIVDPPLLRGTVLAIAWFTLAYLATLASAERPWAGRFAPLLACLCVSELLRINQAFLPGGWLLACVVLLAIVAVFAVHQALVDLDEATTDEHQQLEAVTQELSRARAGAEAQAAWREELTHDARNALAGVRAALKTLDRYDGMLDPDAMERLRAAAIGELGHLEHLIGRAAQDRPVDFDVMGAIRNAVEARRAAGLRVDVHDFSCLAHGRPGDLVTVVQNLLVNAHQHGLGKDVRVCLVQAHNRVELFVSDRGPGLSDEHAARLFERGSRGAESRGSGLGLFVSRTLMREMGGDLELRAHQDGAVFVVSLPVAKADHARMPVQRLPAELAMSVGS